MRLRRGIRCLVLLAAGTLALGIPAYGDEKYSVSGVVTFPEAEVLFVSLYSLDRFKNFKNNTLPPEPYTQVIELSAEQKKTGRATFTFKGIPKGTYGVVAFRETKKNMKRDRSRYFKDPVSEYKMIDFSGDWNDIQFELNKEVRGIEIRF